MGQGRGYPILDRYGNEIIILNSSDIGYGYGDMFKSRGRGLRRQYPSLPAPLPCLIICLYVDNMLIFDTCNDIVFKTKSFLASKFDMKDMGEASVILGVKIIRKGGSILLSHEHYVKKLLRKYKYYDFKSVSTPYDANSQLKKNREEPIPQTQYA